MSGDKQEKRQVQVFIGPTSQMQLDPQCTSSFREWTEEEKEAYYEKVRSRAKAKAQEILEQALQEADSIKEQARKAAYEAGYEEGMSQAMTERDNQLAEMSERLHDLMFLLEQEKKDIWVDFRSDVLQLIRLSTEKVLSVEMDARRKEILSSLLDEAVGTLEEKQSVQVFVSPEDKAYMQELLAGAEKKGSTGVWHLHEDPQLALGGVRLESTIGITDNSIASRKREVDAIWDKISLSPEKSAVEPSAATAASDDTNEQDKNDLSSSNQESAIPSDLNLSSKVSETETPTQNSVNLKKTEIEPSQTPVGAEK